MRVEIQDHRISLDSCLTAQELLGNKPNAPCLPLRQSHLGSALRRALSKDGSGAVRYLLQEARVPSLFREDALTTCTPT